MTTAQPSAFWADLAEDLKDPEFLRAYIVESMRIATVDAVISGLDDAREAAGMTKAALARAIGSNPDAIRRLLTNGSANPTFNTIVEAAAALGMRVTLEPLPANERKQITEPLIRGEHSDPAALAEHLTHLRRSGRTKTAALV